MSKNKKRVKPFDPTRYTYAYMTEDLPPPHADLTDPARPLADSVTFIPQARKSFTASLIILILCGPALLVGLYFVVYGYIKLVVKGKDGYVSISGIGLPFSFVVLLGLLTWSVIYFWDALDGKLKWKAGRWRYGVFLTPDYCLTRYYGDLSSEIIPRTFIKKAEVFEYLKQAEKGIRHCYAVCLHFKEKTPQGFECCYIHDRFDISVFETAAMINRWFEADVSGVYCSLEEAVKEPENVRVLRLAAMKFKDIPEEVFGFPNLRLLDLSHNHIWRIEERWVEGFTKLTNLKEFDLSGNFLDGGGLDELRKALKKVAIRSKIFVSNDPVLLRED